MLENIFLQLTVYIFRTLFVNQFGIYEGTHICFPMLLRILTYNVVWLGIIFTVEITWKANNLGEYTPQPSLGRAFTDRKLHQLRQRAEERDIISLRIKNNLIKHSRGIVIAYSLQTIVANDTANSKSEYVILSELAISTYQLQ